MVMEVSMGFYRDFIGVILWVIWKWKLVWGLRACIGLYIGVIWSYMDIEV